jgi:hypothetical protein
LASEPNSDSAVDARAEVERHSYNVSSIDDLGRAYSSIGAFGVAIANERRHDDRANRRTLLVGYDAILPVIDSKSKLRIRFTPRLEGEAETQLGKVGSLDDANIPAGAECGQDLLVCRRRRAENHGDRQDE